LDDPAAGVIPFRPIERVPQRPFLARSHIGVRGLVDLQQQASDARPDDADEERDATDA